VYSQVSETEEQVGQRMPGRGGTGEVGAGEGGGGVASVALLVVVIVGVILQPGDNHGAVFDAFDNLV
jgi:hypothetical protein